MTPHFDGSDYVPELDHARLSTQHDRVHRALQRGGWYTLRELHEVTGDPEASILAQIGHLRKARFGSHVILKQRRGEPGRGLWEYHLAAARSVAA